MFKFANYDIVYVFIYMQVSISVFYKNDPLRYSEYIYFLISVLLFYFDLKDFEMILIDFLLLFTSTPSFINLILLLFNYMWTFSTIPNWETLIVRSHIETILVEIQRTRSAVIKSQ